MFAGIRTGRFNLYQLTIPMREANSRAKSLDLKCRFKGW